MPKIVDGVKITNSLHVPYCSSLDFYCNNLNNVSSIKYILYTPDTIKYILLKLFHCKNAFNVENKLL